ncbi:hypothetical protein [Elizabethkingia ursingii]|jgi:hypothetical protein|uniref:Uncharacterized protein n=1 Tax=Elizabethkingia ursingii TaxID=1756150 RepID=A0AAJ3NF52_9FLAO|nr:hypothetical protein [Elizabethkingia ursingii]AQX07586.1 hypothetical protein BBD34_02520 [Elizabethkingia ursingii]KUY31871.1 hypothetical protein ATB96_01030 [Elizabethkingia ursingii]OPB79564.1 hypothetical protein BAY32_17915 [Elizabethkingia ursingii]OPB89111.1 hypothetical protein BB021_07065 [Elizabethkingia ursingii]
MALKEFTDLSNQILSDSALTEQQKEEKIIQLADLTRFIECYNSSIKTSEYELRGKVNIIVDEGRDKGILFCDINSLHNTVSYTQLVAEAKRNHGGVKELWLVFVRERETEDTSPALEFIQQENIGYIFDKLFLFDFFKKQVLSLN